MSDGDELLRNFATKAQQVLPPLVAEFAAELDLELDDETTARLSMILARAFEFGTTAGAAEIIAQLIENGIDLPPVNWLRPSDDDAQR